MVGEEFETNLSKRGKKIMLLSLIANKHLIISLQVFVIMAAYPLIPFQCTFLDPVGQAISDFDLNDISFSRMRDEQPADTNIVIVNIGNLGRAGIARQIAIIQSHNPKVIGIDVLFNRGISNKGDSLLQEVLAGSQNIVMVNRMAGYNKRADSYDSIGTSHTDFNKFVLNGYANLPEDESSSFRTVREFRPFVRHRGNPVPAFSAKIVSLVDSLAYQRLCRRGIDLEAINFRGNYNKFFFLDAHSFDDTLMDMSFLAGKIILMGYMGPNLSTPTIEDMFFTPMNSRYAGKSFPDMYGVVIHANIISMILGNSYLNQMAKYWNVLISFLICFGNVWLLQWLKGNTKDWFGALTKLVLLIQSLLYMFISILLLVHYNYKLNITLATVAIFLTTTSIDIYEHFTRRLLEKISTGNKTKEHK